MLSSVLVKSVPYSYHEAILNELFPPEFKVGDTIKVLSLDNDCDWSTGLTSVDLVKGGLYNVAGTEASRAAKNLGFNWYWVELEGIIGKISSNQVRHATPEEIVEAEWEEGKPYRVWLDGDWMVRISTDKIGYFYACGAFQGKTDYYDKYEKL